MSDTIVVNQYGNAKYWEERYQRTDDTFEWYVEWEEFFANHLEELNLQTPILDVGCGTSMLGAHIETAGYYPVVSIDISKTACRKMSQKSPQSFAVIDATRMNFRDECFGSVIDKGTLDALFCNHDYHQFIANMLCEIARVLVPGGIFVAMTFGDEKERLPIFDVPDILPWTLNKHFQVTNDYGPAHIYVMKKFNAFIYDPGTSNLLHGIYSPVDSEDDDN